MLLLIQVKEGLFEMRERLERLKGGLVQCTSTTGGRAGLAGVLRKYPIPIHYVGLRGGDYWNRERIKELFVDHARENIPMYI